MCKSRVAKWTFSYRKKLCREKKKFRRLFLATALGGKNGISPFHYFGTRPWLLGAAQDLKDGRTASNPYLYGDELLNTGAPSLNHRRKRNF
jgi:hypothetical protein